MSLIPNEWAMLSDQLQGIVTGYINSKESGTNRRIYSANSKAISQINQYCEDLKEYVRKSALSYLRRDKIVSIIGGDHSSPLGLMEALTLKYKEFGILTIDINGLDPKLCPGTSSPIPGGFQFDEILYLFRELIKHKKTIIAFDLCEIAAGEQIDWDISVACKLIYNTILYLVSSQSN